MYEQHLLLTTGELFTRTSKEKMDWQTVYGLIKDDTIEISNLCIGKLNYEMLCGENAISNNAPVNKKATEGYRQWWNNRFDKLEKRQGLIDRTTLENTSIRGNVFLERPIKIDKAEVDKVVDKIKKGEEIYV
tara:strand:- start:134 stop:529 length:396 start_codon:yes stop_codon:yes gene_type:complete